MKEIPILVGSGQYVDRRSANIGQSLSPADMAAEAGRLALLDATDQAAFARTIDTLAVARLFEHSVRDKILWPNPFGSSDNMPWSVANRLCIEPKRLLYSEVGGETPQRTVNQIAESIHHGDIRSALIVGAEALGTVRSGLKQGLSFDWNESVVGTFEDLWPDREMASQYEARHGITYPIQVYALFEQARRHQNGLSSEQYRAEIGKLFSPLSKVAAQNPFSFSPIDYTPAEISTVSDDNFLICEPYCKRMVAQDGVNQGAAVVMTSTRQAKKFGIPEQHWVYLHSYADIDELPLLERQELSRSRAQEMALEKVFQDSGMTVDDIDLFDLYSCFPIAVFNACHYMGLPFDGKKKLTVTGGLPFFGGAGNNYSLHAIAEVIALLRNSAFRNALVVSNGGYLSKHSVGLYSSNEMASWEVRSSESNQRLLDNSERVSVVEKTSGLAIIETYAAQYSRSNKIGGFIVGRMISNNERFMAVADSRDEETIRQLFDKQPIGKKINVTHNNAINYFRFIA